MKLSRRQLSALGVLSSTSALVFSACDNAVAPSQHLPPLQPASLDAAAGSWRMILLTGPTQFTVAAPNAAGSAAYAGEVAAVKSAQANITGPQRLSVEYWSGGGVMRWNEITRGLVARFNLPPAPAVDGTYPIPDAENPYGDPNFPFANPAYAARAFSYVSAAQADAMKAAWYWKFQYDRLSPAKNDPSVRALVPISDLPSYPSEDAVLSGVTAELLKLFFPAAVDDITRHAAEQRTAAFLSGKATASDIAAGLALGRQVAAIYAARAANDGMKFAGGTPGQWKAFADSARARGEIAWVSQEQPARPPMLPYFGRVQTWMMTPADLDASRPPAPPSTSSAQMQQELAEVKHAVDHLTREQLAIALKWNDGAGTYTPPGHWNTIAADYVRDANMSEVRAARTFALLNMAMHDAAVGCWDAKFHYYNPRPSQLDPTIKTPIGLPNFPSFSSGHSTFSAAADVVLSYIFPAGASSLDAMRNEAAISRLYGGIHYRSDIEKGKAHGQAIGGFTQRWAEQDGSD
jgi:hypothetical protein